MRLPCCLSAYGGITAIVVICSAILSVPAHAEEPSALWKIADVFPVAVKVYPRTQAGKEQPDDPESADKEPTPIASYDLHIVVLPVLPFEECGCWKLQFVAFSKLLAYRDPYRLWLDRNNGRTRKASRFVGPKETPFDAANVAPMVLDAPVGYPVEIIPQVDDAVLPTQRAGTTIEIKTHKQGKDIERTAIVRVDGKAELEVRQRRQAGAKWWSEYERFYRGKRDLQARIIAVKPAQPIVKSQPPAVPPPVASPSDSDDFRRDPRLQKRINADLHHCPLQNLLTLLSRETAVPLSLEKSLAETGPQLGSSSNRNVPAWRIMERTAQDFLVDGRWYKDGSGYQLAATRAIETERLPPRRLNLPLFYGLHIAAVGLVLFLMRKRRPSSRPNSEEENTAINQ